MNFDGGEGDDRETTWLLGEGGVGAWIRHGCAVDGRVRQAGGGRGRGA